MDINKEEQPPHRLRRSEISERIFMNCAFNTQKTKQNFAREMMERGTAVQLPRTFSLSYFYVVCFGKTVIVYIDFNRRNEE
jgi:hypothetical protein